MLWLLWVLTAVCLASCVALVAMMLVIANAGRPPTADETVPTVEEQRAFVLWHAFYVNPGDPRGWVPKTMGYGKTVNFRTRRNAAVFGSLIALTMLSCAGMLVVAVYC